ncbi:hypothetical protein [Chroococcidiopsis sp. SAG 2025]|nr:hypothetical protein [Chroococcidiopsis sp. SAG 2025]
MSLNPIICQSAKVRESSAIADLEFEQDFLQVGVSEDTEVGVAIPLDRA